MMNFQKMAGIIFLLLALSSGVFGADISGKTYEWYSLQQLDGVIVSINSLPEQTVVTQNGSYLFHVKPGNYDLHAEYVEKGVTLYETDENLSIPEDGNYSVDLILFPALSEPGDTDIPPIQNQNQFPIVEWALIGIGAIAIGAGTIIHFKKMKKLNSEASFLPAIEPASEVVAAPSTDSGSYELDKYALEVLEVLKKSGNRLTQKEIREKITDIGEAKISLILTELEDRKMVKKIKKGRGNIVILIENNHHQTPSPQNHSNENTNGTQENLQQPKEPNQNSASSNPEKTD